MKRSQIVSPFFSHHFRSLSTSCNIFRPSDNSISLPTFVRNIAKLRSSLRNSSQLFANLRKSSYFRSSFGNSRYFSHPFALIAYLLFIFLSHSPILAPVGEPLTYSHYLSPLVIRRSLLRTPVYVSFWSPPRGVVQLYPRGIRPACLRHLRHGQIHYPHLLRLLNNLQKNLHLSS